MAIISCKTCNEVFSSMTGLTHHLCPNWKDIGKWKNNPRKKQNIEEKHKREFYKEKIPDSETLKHQSIIKAKKCITEL